MRSEGVGAPPARLPDSSQLPTPMRSAGRTYRLGLPASGRRKPVARPPTRRGLGVRADSRDGWQAGGEGKPGGDRPGSRRRGAASRAHPEGRATRRGKPIALPGSGRRGSTKSRRWRPLLRRELGPQHLPERSPMIRQDGKRPSQRLHRAPQGRSEAGCRSSVSIVSGWGVERMILGRASTAGG